MRGFVLAALCAGALGLPACGDDDEDATTTPETGTAGVEATESSDTEPSASEAKFTDALRAQLEAAGVESSQVDCVVDELERAVSDDAIAEAEEQIQSGGEFPQEILDASMDAAQQCLTP